MKNALNELLREFKKIGKTTEDISHARIVYKRCGDDKATVDWKRGFDGREDPVDCLDFTYGDGYGPRELLGYVVFNDGTWLERAGYDGFEWWEYKKLPSLADLKTVTP